jgi:hypothetical protein
VGIRLAATDLVIDVDPRNYEPGDDQLMRLSEAVGTDLSDAPTVITGSGGMHHFWSKPADVKVVGKLADFQGIDFKASEGLVVAAGSLHPTTGCMYRLDPDLPPISLVGPVRKDDATMMPIDCVHATTARVLVAMRHGGKPWSSRATS